MSEQIKPALTAEEWAAGEAYRRTGESKYSGDQWVSLLHDGQAAISTGYSDIRVTPKAFHVLAALCLHGQPFGFTREDVEMLRKEANRWSHGDAGAAVETLADRIEALLPPEDS